MLVFSLGILMQVSRILIALGSERDTHTGITANLISTKTKSATRTNPVMRGAKTAAESHAYLVPPLRMGQYSRHKWDAPADGQQDQDRGG